MEKTRVCIYTRVSTQLQDYDLQLVELKEYADKMGYDIVKTFSEKISGAKKVAERQAMSELTQGRKSSMMTTRSYLMRKRMILVFIRS